MEDQFYRALLQRLYSLEKLCQKLADKVTDSKEEVQKLLGEMHERINAHEREREDKCEERRENILQRIDALRETLSGSDDDVSKTHQQFRDKIRDRFSRIHARIDGERDARAKVVTGLATIETRLKNIEDQEKSKFGKYAVVVSIAISVLSLVAVTVFGILSIASR